MPLALLAHRGAPRDVGRETTDCAVVTHELEKSTKVTLFHTMASVPAPNTRTYQGSVAGDREGKQGPGYYGTVE